MATDVVVEGTFLPLAESFTGGGDLEITDPQVVLDRLKEVVAEWKEAGKPIDCTITAALTGLPTSPPTRTTMMVASGAIDLATGREGPVQNLSFGVFSIPPYKIAGKTDLAGLGCSLSAVQAHVPQLGVILGTVLGSLAGILIVRRRKK